jgi:hypothetical protein
VRLNHPSIDPGGPQIDIFGSLALASQSLSVIIALTPYVRETFRRHLSQKQAVMLVEFDKLKRVGFFCDFLLRLLNLLNSLDDRFLGFSGAPE